MLIDEARLLDALRAMGIAYAVHEHAAVFTVEESAGLHARLPGVHSKNLFLKDAGRRFLLLSVPAAMRVNLKALAPAIGARKLSFGQEGDMQRLLGVTPGAVTPLAAFNDGAGEVGIVLERSLAAAPLVNVHPLRNTATLALAGPDLVAFLASVGHRPHIADVPERASC
jgi:Ala-tRNA(Pro) deacylase